MIPNNHDTICMHGLVQSARSSRHHGEAETPTSNQPPRGAQGRRLLGPAALRPCPSPLGTTKSMRALGPGATVGVLGTGVPRLACLRPAACLEWGPSVAHLHQHKAQDPREGPSLMRRTTWRFLRHGLLWLAREE